MNPSRRHCIGALAASPALMVAGTSLAAARPALPSAAARGLYTLQTAPDYASRLALSRPLKRLTDGAAPGTDLATAVHANFARIIEQNFASAGPARAARWCDTIETRSLACLAQTYLNATEHRGQSAWALDILAQRLDAARLAQLSAHFGFARVHAAVLRVAPGKLEAFNARADVHQAGPVLGDLRLPGAASATSGAAIQPNNYGLFLDYTIEEVYLAFRTAPIGATSVAASMFQTGMVLGAALPLAWAGGQFLGRYLTLGMQVYTPSVWDLIVDSVGWWLHEFTRQPETPPTPIFSPEEQMGQHIGQIQRDGFTDVFQLEANLYDGFAIAGGDYLSAHEWSTYIPYEPYGGGGSFCGNLDGCHGNQTRQGTSPGPRGSR